MAFRKMIDAIFLSADIGQLRNKAIVIRKRRCGLAPEPNNFVS
jgi:hypothetical protein